MTATELEAVIAAAPCVVANPAAIPTQFSCTDQQRKHPACATAAVVACRSQDAEKLWDRGVVTRPLR